MSEYMYGYISVPTKKASTYMSLEFVVAWQAFRDWLNGTPEQWQEIILQDDDMGPLTDCDMEDSYE